MRDESGYVTFKLDHCVVRRDSCLSGSGIHSVVLIITRRNGSLTFCHGAIQTLGTRPLLHTVRVLPADRHAHGSSK